MKPFLMKSFKQLEFVLKIYSFSFFLITFHKNKVFFKKKNSIEAAAGVTPFGTHYWSSSEHNSSKAKSVDMSSGNDSNTNKFTQRNVRAIRTFSGGTGLYNPGTGFD